MEFKIDRDVFLKSLAHVQGVVEKKNTLPIISMSSTRNIQSKNSGDARIDKATLLRLIAIVALTSLLFGLWIPVLIALR